MKGASVSNLGNADQTPLTFDLPINRTVDFVGNSSVTIKTTGSEKNRFTVMLACTADGTKLPPYVIFKRKTLLKEKFPPGLIVRVQEKGWMDEPLTLDWICSVWGTLNRGTWKMLVLDSFCAHHTAKAKAALKAVNTDLVIIPGGLTSMLQPLNMSINKPFKSAIHKLWNEWMMSRQHTFTATGRQRRVDLVTICQWILTAWEQISISCITNRFKKCCISKAIDGSEDDILWEEPTDENVDPTDISAAEAELETELGAGYYTDYDGEDADYKRLEAIFNEDSDDEDFLGFP